MQAGTQIAHAMGSTARYQRDTPKPRDVANRPSDPPLSGVERSLVNISVELTRVDQRLSILAQRLQQAGLLHPVPPSTAESAGPVPEAVMFSERLQERAAFAGAIANGVEGLLERLDV